MQSSNQFGYPIKNPFFMKDEEMEECSKARKRKRESKDLTQ